jgi:hypothetical protein
MLQLFITNWHWCFLDIKGKYFLQLDDIIFGIEDVVIDILQF